MVVTNSWFILNVRVVNAPLLASCPFDLEPSDKFLNMALGGRGSKTVGWVVHVTEPKDKYISANLRLKAEDANSPHKLGASARPQAE